MTPEQHERFELILQALEPETKNMTGSSPGFVRDQIERNEKYGAGTRVSEKQMSWLESLYQKHVGPLSEIGHAPTVAETRDDVLGEDGSEPDSDMDDEIPF